MSLQTGGGDLDVAAHLTWRSQLPSSADGLMMESRADSWGGEFQSFCFSGARMYYLHADVQQTSRRRPCRNRFAPMAVIPLQGELSLRQQGRSRVVHRGEFAFIDSAAPFEMAAEVEFNNLYLHFPPCSFVPSHFYKAICRTGDATSDFDALFKSAIESVWRNAGELRPTEHGAALNSILSLCPLTSPFRESSQELEPCIRVTKAMNFIEDNLAEDWLNPQSVADAQGVSRRYLDDRFGLLGLRIERWIWERRLTRAREELTLSARASRASAKTVIQVALDNGFKSPSHFSRSFSARFGVSPREFRKGIEDQARLH